MSAWECQEPGWWTCEKGAVCRDWSRNWECYLMQDDGKPAAAIKATIKEAKEYVETHGKSNKPVKYSPLTS